MTSARWPTLSPDQVAVLLARADTVASTLDGISARLADLEDGGGRARRAEDAGDDPAAHRRLMP